MMFSEREPFANVETDFTNTQTAVEPAVDDNSTVLCSDDNGNLPAESTPATEYAVDDNGTEPAPTDADTVADAFGGTPMHGTDGDAVGSTDDGNDVSEYGSEYNRLPEGMYFENGILFEGERPRPSNSRVTSLVRVTGELRDRIKVVSNLERRTMTTVVEEAVKQFLDKSMNEPRPYLPYTDAPQNARITWYPPVDQDALLRGRAMAEGRDVMTLVRRALLDYVESSPYDPLRLMRPETAPSEEIPGAEAEEEVME